MITTTRTLYLHLPVVSQLLDHILLSPALNSESLLAEVARINADYPEVFEGVSESPFRSSDHDPLVLRITILPHHVFIPMGERNGLGNNRVSEPADVHLAIR